MRRIVLFWCLVCVCVLAATPAFALVPDKVTVLRSEKTYVSATEHSADWQDGRGLWIEDSHSTTSDGHGRSAESTFTRLFTLDDSYHAVVDGRDVTVVRHVWGSPGSAKETGSGARFTFDGPASFEQHWVIYQTGETGGCESGKTQVSIDARLRATDEVDDRSTVDPYFDSGWNAWVWAKGRVTGWNATVCGHATENGVDYMAVPVGWTAEWPLAGGFLSEHNKMWFDYVD